MKMKNFKILAYTAIFVCTGFHFLGALGDEEKTQCHPHGNLKFLKKVFRLRKGQKKIGLNLEDISPVWKDIGQNLGKATKIVEKFLERDDESALKPIYTNPEYSVYLLETKYILRLVAAACATHNLKNFIPTETSTTLEIMKYLGNLETPITKVPVFVKAVGDNLFNGRNEHLTDVMLWKAKPSATVPTVKKRFESYAEYNSYPTLMALGEGKIDLTYETTKEADQDGTKYSILCEGATRQDTRGSTYKRNFERLLQTFDTTANAISPLFTERGKMQNSPTETMDGNTNMIKIFPSKELSRLSTIAFRLGAANFWQEGQATNAIIQEATKLLSSYGPNKINKDFPMKIGDLGIIKSALGFHDQDFLAPNVKIVPLGKTTSATDFSITANVFYQYSRPSDEIVQYQILPNNVDGRIVTHPYLFKDGNNYYAGNVDFTKGQKCVDELHCEIRSPLAGPLSRSCGNFIVSAVGGVPDSCQYKDYPIPIGYRISCKPDSTSILSAGENAELKVICDQSNLGTYEAKPGLTYLNTSCELKTDDQVVLTKGSGTNFMPPAEVQEDDDLEDVVTYSIFGGTSFLAFSVLASMILILFRKIEGKPICGVQSPLAAASNLAVSLQSLNEHLANGMGKFRDDILPHSQPSSRAASPIPSAPLV